MRANAYAPVDSPWSGCSTDPSVGGIHIGALIPGLDLFKQRDLPRQASRKIKESPSNWTASLFSGSSARVFLDDSMALG